MTLKYDWICDGCGRRFAPRATVPRTRCHGFPLRPQGEPWVSVLETFYAYCSKHPGWGSELPADYWISAKVLERFEAMGLPSPSEVEAMWKREPLSTLGGAQ
jgi:ribosomal protein L40E